MTKLTIKQALEKAKSHARRGEHEVAAALYKSILQSFPSNTDAKKGLTALKGAQRAARERMAPHTSIDQLLNLYNQGQLEVAMAQAIELSAQYPKAIAIWNILGASSAQLGKLDQAVQAFKQIITLNPNQAVAYFNMGNALKDQGKIEEAIAAYNKALFIKPDYQAATNNLVVALKSQGKNGEKKAEEALATYNQAQVAKIKNANFHFQSGLTHQEQGNLVKAIEAYKKALTIKPDYAEAYSNMGVALQEQGNLVKAIEAYKKALAIKPDYADAYYNMGNALKEQGKLDEAIEAYSKALAIKPDYANAYYNMGNALKEQGKLDEAIDAYNKALVIKPDNAEAYLNLGNALQDQSKLDEAIEAYNKALAIKPDYAVARVSKLHQQAHICDWTNIAKDIELLPQLGTTKEHIPPFALLSLEDSPERHRIRSEIFVAAKYPQRLKRTWARPLQKPERLRIGYFSADFHDFPGMYLMAGLLEKHDRTKFEISAFSYGPNDDGPMRNRIINAVDQFIDIRTSDTGSVTDLARQKRIDIAVHRNGYTKNNRTELFASGLAPVQINYLGYPGTLGADFIDYIVADPFVIPDATRRHYSEQIIYLPNTYQPNDGSRTISDKTITREEMGIPNCAFVFCCFNQNYKISPIEFDIWMRILGRVESSILWLLKSNKWAEQNLKRQAEARGVSAERIIFAEKMPQAEHLARHRLADLFIDTFNYNAHTTTSDALWAGLPVVTKAGRGFAARVAGSLLNAIGLPELVTTTHQDYEEVILELATDPPKLAQVKERLAENRLTQPLFDTELYTKHLENGYQQAYHNYLEGNKPKTIIVPER